MRRTLWIFLVGAAFLGAARFGDAQAAPSPTERAVGWLSAQWNRVQREGRPAAERIVREFPARFRNMKAQVSRLSQVAGKFADSHRLEERKALLLELWRVRGSLNLLSLCSPNVLHDLTGLDTKTLVAMQEQVAAARARLMK